MSKVVSDLNEIISKAVEGLGYDFVGLDYSPGQHGSMIRVYADLIGGISLDDCQQISRHLVTVLSVELGEMEFSLEVSSPGLDRKLFNVEQCTKHISSKVKVVLRTAIDGRRKFTGVLSNVDGNMLSLTVDGETFNVDFINIREIRIVPDLNVGKSNQRGK